MGLGNLSNCSRCDKLFIKVNSDICPACVKAIDDEYQICADYIRENKLVSIYDLSDATGVAVKQIIKFVKEGRISIEDNPNIVYPCESCGTPINEGKLCKKCSERLHNDFKQAVNNSNNSNSTAKEIDEKSQNAYYEIKNRF